MTSTVTLAWHLVTSDWLRWPARAAVDAVVAAAVCVAGVALGDIHRPFAWQAWHLVTSTVTLAWQARHFWDWTGSGGALGPQWTRWSPPPFAWQAWHLVTPIVPLRGRRGTSGTRLAPVARSGRSGRGCRRRRLRGRRGTW